MSRARITICQCSDIHKLYDSVTDTDIMILTSAGSKIDQSKHYDEKNTYISYYDVISREQKSNQQQIHRNKTIKRILEFECARCCFVMVPISRKDICICVAISRNDLFSSS